MACGVGVRRGVAWGVRSQVVGMATSRARAGDRRAHASRIKLPALARYPTCARASSRERSATSSTEKTEYVILFDTVFCENKTRYQVVLVDITLDRLTCMKRSKFSN